MGNTYGVAFCNTAANGCELCAIKVLDKGGSGSTSGIIAGISHVVDYCSNHQGQKCVVNMSLGGGPQDTLDAAIRSAVEAGVTFILAAGNSAADACNYSPARTAEAITVGSTAQGDTSSSFSNFGQCVDFWAPGSSITSAYKTSSTDTAIMSGTSMACPRK